MPWKLLLLVGALPGMLVKSDASSSRACSHPTNDRADYFFVNMVCSSAFSRQCNAGDRVWCIRDEDASLRSSGSPPSKEYIEAQIDSANDDGSFNITTTLGKFHQKVPATCLLPGWDGSLPPPPPTVDDEASVEGWRAFRSLDFSGASQNGFGPENWGVSFAQLEEIMQHENWAKSEMTMYDVVERIVKPQTKGKGVGYALLKNPHGLRANIMVSHAWSESYHDFLDTLRPYAESNPDAVFWVCSMAIYQNEDMKEMLISKQLGKDLKTGAFATVLRQSKEMVAILTPQCDIYKRMWCVFEIFTAVRLGVPVRLLSLENFANLHSAYRNAVCDFASVDSAKARCGNQLEPMNSDERMIRAEIETLPGGFDTVDMVVSWIKILAMRDCFYAAGKECRPTSIGISGPEGEKKCFLSINIAKAVTEYNRCFGPLQKSGHFKFDFSHVAGSLLSAKLSTYV